jgi:hypothetical protein
MATSGEWGPADEAQVEVTGLVERLEKLRALDEKLAALGKTGKVLFMLFPKYSMYSAIMWIKTFSWSD